MSETKQYDEDWVNEFLRHLQEGPVEPERAEEAEKIRRIIDGTKRFEDFFNPKKTSQTADKIQGKIEFITPTAPDAKIDRLTMYSFDKFFRPDGEIRLA